MSSLPTVMFNELYNEDGKKYYVSAITKQVYWELPKDVRAVCIKSNNTPTFQPYDSMPAISRAPEQKPRPSTPIFRAQASTYSELPHPKQTSEWTPAVKPQVQRPSAIKKTPVSSSFSGIPSPSEASLKPRSNSTETNEFKYPAHMHTLSLESLRGMLDEIKVPYHDCKGKKDMIKKLMDHFTSHIPPPLPSPPTENKST